MMSNPFALIKYLDDSFKKDNELKSENAVLRIKIPDWITVVWHNK